MPSRRSSLASGHSGNHSCSKRPSGRTVGFMGLTLSGESGRSVFIPRHVQSLPRTKSDISGDLGGTPKRALQGERSELLTSGPPHTYGSSHGLLVVPSDRGALLSDVQSLTARVQASPDPSIDRDAVLDLLDGVPALLEPHSERPSRVGRVDLTPRAATAPAFWTRPSRRFLIWRTRACAVVVALPHERLCAGLALNACCAVLNPAGLHTVGTFSEKWFSAASRRAVRQKSYNERSV